MGKKFTSPPRHNEREWEKLGWMIANGWNGSNWPVRPDMTLLEVQSAVREWRETIEKKSRGDAQNESLKERRRAANRLKESEKRQRLEWKRQWRYQEAVLVEVAKLQEKENTP